MATSITLRSTKGSALTHTEVDDNFSNLKTTADAAAVSGAVTSSGLTMATSKLLGRSSASTGAIQEITVGSGLSLSAGQIEVNFTGYLTTSDAATTYQPLDGDLTAIAALSGTSGYIKKTAANTYSLDTATYLTTTDAASTYQTQSGMSSYLTTSSAASTYLTQTDASTNYQPKDADLTAIAGLAGTSGFLKKTAADTWSLDTSTYLTTATASSTYASLSSANTFTQAQTFPASGVKITGSSTGVTTFTSANSSATNYTITLPAITDTAVTLTATQTLTNKTFTGYTETVFTITDGASVDINPANGTIQLWTLGANRTPSASSFSNGQSVTLMIADGTAYAVTWTTIGVTWVGGSAPTLPTTGYGVIQLWKAGGTVYGASVGNV